MVTVSTVILLLLLFTILVYQKPESSYFCIKNNLRINYENRETKTVYNEYCDGNYKVQKWNYYKRYNKVDINDNIDYDNWSWYDSSTNRYKYKSSCLIF